MPLSLYDLTRPKLVELVRAWGFAPAHANRLWRYLYRERADSLAALPDLPSRLRERLVEEAVLLRPVVERVADAGDQLTRKFALRLAGGAIVETVRMEFAGRTTACVSSQAGCPVGCVFCATGRMGFGRNLTAGEIVAQIVHVARSGPLRNVVLMGMGEPLLNYDAVAQAIEIAHDSGGLALASKRITLSTIGVPEGIVRLARDRLPCSLAVSLHAATQDEREALIPAARVWPLAELLDACRDYTQRLGRRIFFEWTLIAGQNDSAGHAVALARLIQDIPAQVNLIPLNPTDGFAGRSASRAAIDGFRETLRAHGIPCSIRQHRGVDVAAGCGQLAGV